MPETYEGTQVYIGVDEYNSSAKWPICTNFSVTYVVVPNRGVNIISGYETKNDRHKKQFIIFAEAKYESVFGKRTMKSLIREWKAHNICYRKGWYKDRAKDTFLDANEKWYRRVFYWFVTLIFKEK